jgi:hypothetical protein
LRRAFLLSFVVLGIPAVTFGQEASSHSQTLQALLTEVHELRQDLRISLAGVQSAQILLSRLQSQQAAVTRASDHLDDARSKLADAQTRQKHWVDEVKQLEDALSAEENLA